MNLRLTLAVVLALGACANTEKAPAPKAADSDPVATGDRGSPEPVEKTDWDPNDDGDIAGPPPPVSRKPDHPRLEALAAAADAVCACADASCADAAYKASVVSCTGLDSSSWVTESQRSFVDNQCDRAQLCFLEKTGRKDGANLIAILEKNADAVCACKDQGCVSTANEKYAALAQKTATGAVMTRAQQREQRQIEQRLEGCQDRVPR